MTSIFLKAKHWQLFLLTFGISMIFQFVLMGTMIANIGSENNPNPSVLFSYIKLFPIMMVIFTGVFFGWFWSIVTRLQSKIPEEARMKLGRFKILLFILLVYLFAISILIGGVMNGLISEPSGTIPSEIFKFIATIIRMYLFFMFCIFHSIYFVAKTFKTAKLQKQVSFSDFSGEFFMIWFYPIGIWIIQPKINKIIEE